MDLGKYKDSTIIESPQLPDVLTCLSVFQFVVSKLSRRFAGILLPHAGFRPPGPNPAFEPCRSVGLRDSPEGGRVNE